MVHITMCADSGTRETKSQNVSWAEPPVGISLWGSGFYRMYEVRKLDRILNEEHWHVVAHQIEVAFIGEKNFTAKPRTSRTVSPDPRGPCTVEKRTKKPESF